MSEVTREEPAATSGRLRSPQNLVAGAALVALASLALWAGADLDGGTLRSVGPGMVPRAVAVLVGAAGLGLVAASFAIHGKALARWSLRGPLFVTLAVIAFGLTIRSPGLVVAGPLVVLVGGAASPEVRPRELAIFAVLVTAFCVGLFRFVLGLPIPVLHLPGLLTI
jgi:putative tricarboxylic transport membrane protein